MTSPKRFHLVLGGLAVVAVALVLWTVLHGAPAKAKPPHATPVTAVRATVQSVPLTLTALGGAQAWTSDTIFAQVSGKLLQVGFTEGSDVHQGQVLAQVDPAPFKAALEQAEGTLQRDQAVLGGARRDLERYQHLAAENAIARQTAEDQAATVAQDEGTVKIDQGAVATARINLAYCRIVSPISGRAGVRLVDPGNLVSASGSTASTPGTAAATSTASASGSGGSGIVVINQVQPIAVTFTVPEGQFQQLVTLSHGFTRPLAVQALSQETGETLDNGELTVADNRVDAATGTVELKARFPNAQRRLWPGQFVNVKLTLQTLTNETVIPAGAVNRGPDGQFAFVVGADDHAVSRPVKLAATEGGLAIVQSGVSPGEMVVVDGQMTLKNGSLIRIVQNRPQAQAAAR